jgi:hypothetical protein
MGTSLFETKRDPYEVNFEVWKNKTHSHLIQNGSRSHKAALNSAEAARELISQKRANLAGALKKNDKASADAHSEKITKLQGVHDGILSGLTKAGYLHPRDAQRKAFQKHLITESFLSALRGDDVTPKPVVGIWFGKGSATEHPAYQQGVKSAQTMSDDYEIEHLKNSAVKAHEKHVQLALNHEDKLRDVVKNQTNEHPDVEAERQTIQKHKDLADTFHAFARGLHRAQTE